MGICRPHFNANGTHFFMGRCNHPAFRSGPQVSAAGFIRGTVRPLCGSLAGNPCDRQLERGGHRGPRATPSGGGFAVSGAAIVALITTIGAIVVAYFTLRGAARTAQPSAQAALNAGFTALTERQLGELL